MNCRNPKYSRAARDSPHSKRCESSREIQVIQPPPLTEPYMRISLIPLLRDTHTFSVPSSPGLPLLPCRVPFPAGRAYPSRAGFPPAWPVRALPGAPYPRTAFLNVQNVYALFQILYLKNRGRMFFNSSTRIPRSTESTVRKLKRTRFFSTRTIIGILTCLKSRANS